MAILGQVVSAANAKRAVCLYTGTGATNGQPSAATAGIPCYPDESIYSSDSGVCFATRAARETTIFFKAPVNSGQTGSVTLRLWGYLAAAGEWFPIGTGTDAGKGVLNAGTAIGEEETDKLLHCEPFLLAGHFDRLYLEITASAQLASAEAWVVAPHNVSF